MRRSKTREPVHFDNQPGKCVAESLERRVLMAAGDLDPSFGSAGKAFTDFGNGSVAFDAARLPDGKLLVVGGAGTLGIDGTIAVARFNANGSIDTTFGAAGTGRVTVDVPGRDGGDRASAIALLDNGQFLVGGIANFGGGGGGSFLVARFNADGSLDTSFNPGGTDGPGVASVNFAGTGVNEVNDLAVRPGDGSIILAGQASVTASSSDSSFVLVGLQPDGSLDPSFNSGGPVGSGFQAVDFTAGDQDSANAVVLQPDGKVLASGAVFTSGAGGGYVFAIARFNADGTPDTGFGSAGQIVGPADSGVGNALALVPDGSGKFVVAGMKLIAYDASGAADTTFGGGDGVTDLNLIALDAQALSDGRLFVAGIFETATNNQGRDFALARFTADGALDPTFAAGGAEGAGLAVTDFAGQASPTIQFPNDDVGMALVLQPDGRAVVAGSAFLTNPGAQVHDDFALVRYLGDGSIVPATDTFSAALTGLLPGSAVTGQKTKAAVTVSLTNTSGQAFNGPVKVQLYVSTDQNLDGADAAAGSVTKKLKLKASAMKTLKVKVGLFPSVSNGAYFLLVRAESPANASAALSATAASATQVALAVPFVNVTGTFATAPTSIVSGARASAALQLTNAGNVNATGPLTVTLNLPAPNPALPPVRRRVNIKPGATITFKIKFRAPTTLVPGTYPLTATIQLEGEPESVITAPGMVAVT